MNRFLNNVKRLRTDLSDWLIHFTKGNNDEASRRLIKILSEGIKGYGEPICFTESPIIEFSKLFKLFSAYPNPRFAPFGIAIKKDKLFDLGGRPAIYLKSEEKKYLKEEIRFLHVAYDPKQWDFTWQREWRIKSDCLSLGREDCVVIVPDDIYAEDFLDFGINVYREESGEISTEPYFRFDWYYITLNEIEGLPKGKKSDELIVRLLSSLKDFEKKDWEAE